MSSASDNVAGYATSGGTYVVYEEDPMKTFGRIVVIYGVAAGITGAILWNKGAKKLNRYKEREGITYRFSAQGVALSYRL